MSFALRDTRTGLLIREATPKYPVMVFEAWGDALHYARPQVDAQGNRTLEVVELAALALAAAKGGERDGR